MQLQVLPDKDLKEVSLIQHEHLEQGLVAEEQLILVVIHLELILEQQIRLLLLVVMLMLIELETEEMDYHQI